MHSVMIHVLLFWHHYDNMQVLIFFIPNNYKHYDGVNYIQMTGPIHNPVYFYQSTAFPPPEVILWLKKSLCFKSRTHYQTQSSKLQSVPLNTDLSPERLQKGNHTIVEALATGCKCEQAANHPKCGDVIIVGQM